MGIMWLSADCARYVTVKLASFADLQGGPVAIAPNTSYKSALLMAYILLSAMFFIVKQTPMSKFMHQSERM